MVALQRKTEIQQYSDFVLDFHLINWQIITVIGDNDKVIYLAPK